ncbi:MAG TPA: hypothetical protein P5277_02260 [Candidatus Paceibacterota bacterium]|nr:hypothetical protein [Candidatus Paceibacterota bacterium]
MPKIGTVIHFDRYGNAVLIADHNPSQKIILLESAYKEINIGQKFTYTISDKLTKAFISRHYRSIDDLTNSEK